MTGGDDDDRRRETAKRVLNEKLRKKREGLGLDRPGDQGGDDRSDSSAGRGYGRAFRLSSEFISAILVGAAIGYLIDYFAGTAPWAMIVFLLLGFVAGILNVLRATGELAPPRMGRDDEKRDGGKRDGGDPRSGK